MEPRHSESLDGPACSGLPQPEGETTTALEHAPPDPGALVQVLVESGEWPAPEVLEQIASAGDAATAPLLEVLRTDPRGWPDEAPLCNVIGLLSVIRPVAAIPALVSVLKRYDEGTAHDAAEAIARFGQEGFETLIELFDDPSITGYRRFLVSDAALNAAGNDPTRRARIAEVARHILDDQVAMAREEMRSKGWIQKNPPDDDLEFDDDEYELSDWDDEPDDWDDELDDEVGELDDETGALDDGDALDVTGSAGNAARPEHEESAKLKLHAGDQGEPLEVADETRDEDLDDDEDDLDDDEDDLDDDEDDDLDEGDEDEDEEAFEEESDFEVKPFVSEEVAYFSGYLAELADRSARETIKAAYQEGLADESVVDEGYVDELYEAGGTTPDEDEGWLSSYQRDYQSHLDELRSALTFNSPRMVQAKNRQDYDLGQIDVAPPPAVTDPIRNIEPRVGRNDPCWCGSGKKYKKCHLGKDMLD